MPRTLAFAGSTASLNCKRFVSISGQMYVITYGGCHSRTLMRVGCPTAPAERSFLLVHSAALRGREPRPSTAHFWLYVTWSLYEYPAAERLRAQSLPLLREKSYAKDCARGSKHQQYHLRIVVQVDKRILTLAEAC